MREADQLKVPGEGLSGYLTSGIPEEKFARHYGGVHLLLDEGEKVDYTHWNSGRATIITTQRAVLLHAKGKKKAPLVDSSIDLASVKEVTTTVHPFKGWRGTAFWILLVVLIPFWLISLAVLIYQLFQRHLKIVFESDGKTDYRLFAGIKDVDHVIYLINLNRGNLPGRRASSLD